jgi:hypothetical protein
MAPWFFGFSSMDALRSFRFTHFSEIKISVFWMDFDSLNYVVFTSQKKRKRTYRRTLSSVLIFLDYYWTVLDSRSSIAKHSTSNCTKAEPLLGNNIRLLMWHLWKSPFRNHRGSAATTFESPARSIIQLRVGDPVAIPISAEIEHIGQNFRSPERHHRIASVE